MNNFSISIVDRKPVRTAGMYVVTTMETASQDCPKLWRDEFGPRMASFPVDPDNAEITM